MTLLAGVAYDPAVAVSKATSSLLALTAFDTTNLRVTFTAPANGIVYVRIRTTSGVGAATSGQILLGVLDGATVRGRQSPMANRLATGTTQVSVVESAFLVSGLTPGNSYTWDAAYGVEFAVAATSIRYGGPNDTTANNAYGAFIFEVWSTERLLAGKLYDPGTAVTNQALSSALAITALDTTNLRLTFTAPASGAVLVRQQCMFSGGTVYGTILHGVLDGATVRARVRPHQGMQDVTLAATTHASLASQTIVAGLTPSTSYTWDAAYAVETALASQNVKYGGPDNATQDDAYGGYAFEVWAA
jgi:hypothetical protein